MRISFIATVYNEQSTIAKLLDSLLHQTLFPDEVVIVDGGSTDKTNSIISSYIPTFKEKSIKLIFEAKLGNRSIGRNEAVRLSTGEVLLCSDGGCILDENWVKEISEPFSNSQVEVVAGYYKGKPSTIFEKCLIPYVLVMPDKVDPGNFLPASRSMAFRRSVWKTVGGFPEVYSHNEDYVFAQSLLKHGVNIVFKRSAIANWIPRSSLWESLRMFYRFAYGDIEAGLFRPKVALLFGRFVTGLLLLVIVILSQSFNVGFLYLLICFLYLGWAVGKNYLYVKDPRAFWYLPLLQLTSDIAVITGSAFGLFSLIRRRLSSKTI